jgi:hypothetical protein
MGSEATREAPAVIRRGAQILAMLAQKPTAPDLQNVQPLFALLAQYPDLTVTTRHPATTTDEALIEFTRRAGSPKTLEDRNILAMTMQKRSGEITLELTDQQHARLQHRRD